MNQFEFLARAHRALAMCAFSNDIKVSEVKVSYKSMVLIGFNNSTQCFVNLEFVSIEHLEKAAYGF
nr:unknown function [Klebsiella phage vB_Kpl_K53PH164C2]